MNDDYRDSVTTILVRVFKQAAMDFCLNEEQTKVFIEMFKDRLDLEREWLTQKTYDKVTEELDN